MSEILFDAYNIGIPACIVCVYVHYSRGFVGWMGI